MHMAMGLHHKLVLVKLIHQKKKQKNKKFPHEREKERDVSKVKNSRGSRP